MDGFIDFAFVFALGFVYEKGGVLVLGHLFAGFFGFLAGIEEFDDLIAALNEDLPFAVFFAFGNMIDFGCHLFAPYKIWKYCNT